MSKKITLNLPNILTIIRILLIPLAVYFVLNDKLITGLIVYLAACITDILDGIIARKFNMVTDAGKLLDPLADKLMIITVLITFTIIGIYPWYMLVIIGVKELLMIAGGVYLLKKEVVVQANIFGKLAALATHLSIGFAFLHEFYGRVYFYLMLAAIALTLFSLFQYVNIYLIQQNKAD